MKPKLPGVKPSGPNGQSSPDRLHLTHSECAEEPETCSPGREIEEALSRRLLFGSAATVAAAVATAVGVPSSTAPVRRESVEARYEKGHSLETTPASSPDTALEPTVVKTVPTIVFDLAADSPVAGGGAFQTVLGSDSWIRGNVGASPSSQDEVLTTAPSPRRATWSGGVAGTASPRGTWQASVPSDCLPAAMGATSSSSTESPFSPLAVASSAVREACSPEVLEYFGGLLRHEQQERRKLQVLLMEERNAHVRARDDLKEKQRQWDDEQRKLIHKNRDRERHLMKEAAAKMQFVEMDREALSSENERLREKVKQHAMCQRSLLKEVSSLMMKRDEMRKELMRASQIAGIADEVGRRALQISSPRTSVLEPVSPKCPSPTTCPSTTEATIESVTTAYISEGQHEFPDETCFDARPDVLVSIMNNEVDIKTCYETNVHADTVKGEKDTPLNAYLRHMQGFSKRMRSDIA